MSVAAIGLAVDQAQGTQGIVGADHIAQLFVGANPPSR